MRKEDLEGPGAPEAVEHLPARVAPVRRRSEWQKCTSSHLRWSSCSNNASAASREMVKEAYEMLCPSEPPVDRC
jgi:hypothetical protein